MSNAHIIVGATHTGKTTFIKNLLKKVRNKNALFIYDINNEYKIFFPYNLVDFEEFVYKASFLRNSVQVYEDATGFLSNRSCNTYLTRILVKKRHANNHIIMVFHSLRSVPRYIYELSNYITIFKTNDSPDMTARELKDERIKDIVERIRDNPNPFCFETLKIY